MMKSSVTQQPEEQGTSLPMVCCGICDAGYVPTPTHEDLKYGPAVVLESALMGMSHFCFRCRRAACPACWDEVHGICGSCVEEAHLPFRRELRQLEGVMLPSVQQICTIQEQPTPPMLVCVRPGRFQTELSERKRPSSTPTPAPLLRERRPGQKKPSMKGVEKPTDTCESEEKVDRLPLSFLKIIERLVTIVLTMILVAIMILIVLAEISVPANMVIVRVLHVDIRQEVAYLLYMAQQLH